MWRILQPVLERLAESRLIATDIAADLTRIWGAEITRNAVIGRAHRTGVVLCNQRDAISESMRRRSVSIQAMPFYPCGHPRTEENTYIYLRPSGLINKKCKICNSGSSRRLKKAVR